MAFDSNKPSQPVIKELNGHIQSIKGLLNQLEPVHRIQFINEMMVRLLPVKNTKDSAQEKLNKKHSGPIEF